MAQQGDDQKPVEEYKTLWGARILWPADIPDDMLEDAVNFTQQMMEEHKENTERECPKIAEKIKKHFDEKWGPHWHVTAGKNFGCHAVHIKQRFVYFYIGQFAFLIYQAS
eukprot:TRINITY_DN45451_c0_g1_i1.p1 TRINITY_DN45451_c0_g1~~TRINITY_DN45451_c0_g1_i1.p1  ORF type:complete len:110 (+),score=36.86 TRINITY_DN45451_c0_g1_i1:195-524(+)